jgi:LPXTG-motif cell wall-anchored protein
MSVPEPGGVSTGVSQSKGENMTTILLIVLLVLLLTGGGWGISRRRHG